MFTNLYGKTKTKFQVGFGSWFELEMDWPPQPLHDSAPRFIVVLAKRKLTTYVYAVAAYVRRVVTELVSERVSCLPVSQSAFQRHCHSAWLYDMERIFRIFHIEAYLQVSLASRCLTRDARLWWMTLGERAMQGDSWAEFRALIIARYGPLPNEDADLPYRDPKIYNDMYLGRYLGYAADWRAYPNESMGHYCRRFQNAMLPYILRDLGDPELQALYLFREGLPSEIRIFVPASMAGMTVPVDGAGIPEPLFEGGLLMLENPIPAVPLQEIPPQDAEADAEGNGVDLADFIAAPEDQTEHPPVIIIDSDEDEEDVEEEIEEVWEEQEQGVWEEEIKDFEDDPEEILFDDGDWDVDSDASFVVTIEQID
ncbi:hypothetical protein TIFTF001_042795 [Ficus carica]|uniref:Uncharacterized protein n=1 Tax=Ficus carica TaxID=3494 RepID=A0AA87YVY0_FICCA|nr:hypothetical protein TIFTF001_042795 [Ficus carica]